MPVAMRALPRVMGRFACVAAGSAGRAAGALIRDAEGVVPPIFPADLADPRLQIVNMIALLFAGSLSMLACGYVFESGNFTAGAPSRSSQGAPERRLNG